MDALTLVVFAGAVLAPFADQRLRPSIEREPANEMRATRKRPKLPRTLVDLSAYPAAYEAHYADTFGLRDVLLRWNSLDKIFLFGVEPHPKLVIDPYGGWMDYGGEQTMENQRGIIPLTEEGLRVWLDYWESCRRFCAGNQAQYLFLVCPNKETIYPDHVPRKFNRIGPTRLDQIMAALPGTALQDVILDPRAALNDARAGDRPPFDHLYSVYGTHWNGRGTWVVYQSVMRALARSHPEVRALTEENIEWIEGETSLDSWGPHLYIPEWLEHPVWAPEPTHDVLYEVQQELRGVVERWRAKNTRVRGPRVLVLHDSFGPLLRTLLAGSCPDVIFVQSWFDPQLVIVEQPDVVMEMRVERILVVPPLLPEIARQIMEQQDGPTPEAGEIVMAVDAHGDGPALASEGPARVERSAEGIVFRSEDSRGAWVLPPFTMPPDRRAWLLIEFDADAQGLLIAYRRSETSGQWLRRDASFMPFSAGRQTRTIPLPGPAGTRQLRLHLSQPGQVRIARVEVRATGS